MEIIASALVIFVAVFHIQAFILESILWTTPRARKAFGTNQKTAEITRPLAFNQGVYNLFLSAGLLGSFLLDDPFRHQAQLFFLSCVIVAALAVGISVSKRIMLLQGTPAVLALLLVGLSLD